jgi:hypothetical protein
MPSKTLEQLFLFFTYLLIILRQNITMLLCLASNSWVQAILLPQPLE